MDLLGILSLYADHIIYFLKSMSHLLSLHLSSWRKSSLFFLCLVCFCNAVKTHVEVFAKFLSCCLLNSRQYNLE
ncbi:hypothetical protein Bca4012_052886 [Brassica carinata]|uniref:(rape) hypothetical protein n=1 Tax=Brassica napus TaxID=3708 RepID=A0A816KJ18_BRANA|nr:unnamed protein product [Brassica napus]